MANVALKLGKTEIQFAATARPTRLPPELTEVPGGLYPLYSAAFEVDEYRIMSGWPVSVPKCDIKIDCLVDGDGSVLTNRMGPTDLATNADMRWVADTNYYDETTLRWRPMQSGVSPWECSSTNAPTLVTNYEYRFGEERFVGMTALNFDSDTWDYMFIDLDLAMGGTNGYTLLMAANLNSVYGNNNNVVDNALWGPQNTTGAWSMLTIKDKAIWLTTDAAGAQRGVSIAGGLQTSAPTYMAFAIGRPQTTLYAGSGPSNLQVKALAAGPTPEALSTRFRLGWGPFSTSATMDMALLDLGLYTKILTRDEVTAEITLLSQVYGGDV